MCPLLSLCLLDPRSPFMAIGGLLEVRRILGLQESLGILPLPEPHRCSRFFSLFLSLFQILSRSPSFCVCRWVGWVGRVCLSPVTFPVTGKLAGNFFPLFLLSVKVARCSGRFFCPCPLLLGSFSARFFFFLQPARLASVRCF